MNDATVVFTVLAVIVVLFVVDLLPVEVVAIGAGLVLAATDVLTIGQAFAGFGDTTVIFIAALFVVSEGIDATGVTTWAGRQMVAHARGDRTRLLVLMLLLATLTAVISVNGAVAALLPMVVVVALQVHEPQSQLLMPLAFGAHAGALLALTGTPVHILVSDAARDAGAGGFSYFEFALVGVPAVAGAIAIVVLAGPRLLPRRNPASIPPDLSDHTRTLIEQYALEHTDQHALMNRRVGIAEAIVPPRSQLVGTTVFPGMVTASGDYVILAVQRNGEDSIAGPTRVAVGDMLLLQGAWDALGERIERDPDVLVVDPPSAVRRQALPMGPGARRALTILVVMIILLATGVVSPVVAAVLAAGAMIVTRVVSVPQAYRSISWTTVVLVAAMIPLSDAVQQSGAADRIADALVAVVGDAGPYALLAGVFLVTAIFSQLISNTATALIIIPIAIAAAGDLGVSIRPVLMCVTVAAAGAFLTPVATPANLMVKGPGGYRFTDYWKLGVPMLLLFLLLSTVLVPLFWPF